MGETLAINRTAVFGWVFMGIWLAMLSAFTWLFLRDGGFGQFAEPLEFGLLGLFWLFGLAGAAHVAARPVVRLETAPGGLRITRRGPWRVEVTDIPHDPPPTVDFVETVDSDSDPYFELRLMTPDGTTHKVAEGHDRACVEATEARIRAALGLAVGART